MGWGAEGLPPSHMTYLLTQMPTLGTVPLEEGPGVFLTVEQDLWDWGRCDWKVGAPSRVRMGGCVPQACGTLFPASSAPETVKLIKAVEPQD